MTAYWHGYKVILYPGAVPASLRCGRNVVVVSPDEYYGLAMNEPSICKKIMAELQAAELAA